jgi:hypothetical protein
VFGDWLAVLFNFSYFLDSSGPQDVKHLVRLFVSVKTYFLTSVDQNL